MKKILLLTSFVLLAFCFAGCKLFASQGVAKGENMANKKILVAYYSYSGNTKSIAEKIHSLTGGDLLEIQTVKEYPKNYDDVVAQARQEKENDFRPPLKSKTPNINNYDVIILGTPVWWYTMAQPVKTFLDGIKTYNKVVIPFCTHGGGGASLTYAEMQEFLPDAEVKEGLTVYEKGDESTFGEIKDWLKENLN